MMGTESNASIKAAMIGFQSRPMFHGEIDVVAMSRYKRARIMWPEYTYDLRYFVVIVYMHPVFFRASSIFSMSV